MEAIKKPGILIYSDAFSLKINFPTSFIRRGFLPNSNVKPQTNLPIRKNS
jgi:hypothetical protein